MFHPPFLPAYLTSHWSMFNILFLITAYNALPIWSPPFFQTAFSALSPNDLILILEFSLVPFLLNLPIFIFPEFPLHLTQVKNTFKLNLLFHTCLNSYNKKSLYFANVLTIVCWSSSGQWIIGWLWYLNSQAGRVYISVWYLDCTSVPIFILHAASLMHCHYSFLSLSIPYFSNVSLVSTHHGSSSLTHQKHYLAILPLSIPLQPHNYFNIPLSHPSSTILHSSVLLRAQVATLLFAPGKFLAASVCCSPTTSTLSYTSQVPHDFCSINQHWHTHWLPHHHSLFYFHHSIHSLTTFTSSAALPLLPTLWCG